MEKELKPGMKIRFKWDLYETYYNTDVEYMGTETRTGIIVDYEDTPYQRQMKEKGMLKIQWTKPDKYDDGILWLSKDDKTIVVLNRRQYVKDFLKKLFGYRILVYNTYKP